MGDWRGHELAEDEDDPELQAAPAVLERFKRALNLSLLVLIVLTGVFFLQAQGLDTEALSVRPQHPAGLIGVLFAPLLHGSLGHLAANGFAVLALGTLAGTVFPRATLRALPLLWLGAGFGTWLIGTGGMHIGASGVTHGLGFLVFTLGLLRRDRPAIAAGLIAFFLFGGMVVAVFPTEIGVSWESHLSGALAGVLSAVLFRRADPQPPRKRYSWEDDPEEPESDPDARVLEPDSPVDVPVIWERPPTVRGVVLPFRRRNGDSVN